MRLGVFGGSFNPPHVGHLIVAETVRDDWKLDSVVWIPASRPPHKVDTEIIPSSHRLKMLRAALSGNPAFDVSDIELERGGISYTIDTLDEFRRTQSKESRIFLIIGSDSYRDFGAWHRPEAICDLAELVVYPRKYRKVDVQRRFPASVVDAPVVPISGTDIRQRLRDGRSIRYLVTEAVREYIESRGLYLADRPTRSI